MIDNPSSYKLLLLRYLDKATLVEILICFNLSVILFVFRTIYSWSVEVFISSYSILAIHSAFALNLDRLPLDDARLVAVLVSGNELVTAPSCIQFELLYLKQMSFNIRVPKCVLTAAEDNLLLNTTGVGLGNVWHKFWLPIIVKEPCAVQVQFEIDKGDEIDKTGLIMAISNITLQSANCLNAVNGKNI